MVFGEVILAQILTRTPVRRALVKSFDALFLSSAVAHQVAVRSRGLLVRDYIERALPGMPEVRFEARVAELGDLDRIVRVEQHVFTHPERLRKVIEERHMVLFEHGEALIGFGIIQPVIAGQPAVDLGIAVDAPFRNTGYAIYLFRHLVQHCFAHGLRPIAGCAEDNRASRSMGERVGMVARHRLLELSFAEHAQGV